MTISQILVDRPSPRYGSDKWVVSAWRPSGDHDGYDVQVLDLQRKFDTEDEAQEYADSLRQDLAQPEGSEERERLESLS